MKTNCNHTYAPITSEDRVTRLAEEADARAQVMTDPDFVPERRRVIAAQYVGPCGVCGRLMRQDGTHPAHPEQSVFTERAICRCGMPVVGNEWHMCNGAIRRFGEEDTPAVSLPTAPAQDKPPLEETQADYWTVCDRCNLARAYCRGH